MILLIFTVSAGDQLATPAALPRCPWEPVSPAAFILTPTQLNMPGVRPSFAVLTDFAWEQGAWRRPHAVCYPMTNLMGGGVLYICFGGIHHVVYSGHV